MDHEPVVGPPEAHEVLDTAHSAAATIETTAARIRKLAATAIVAVLMVFSLGMAGVGAALYHIDQTTSATNHTVSKHDATLTATLGAACILIEHANPPLPVPVGCAAVIKKAETKP